MGVCVHRETDLTVPQNLHDNSRINVLSKQQRHTEMSQVVESLAREVRSLEDVLEAKGDARVVLRSANRRREYQFPILPEFSRGNTLQGLSKLVLE